MKTDELCTARVDGVPERKKREETVTRDNVGTFICMYACSTRSKLGNTGSPCLY